MSETIPEKNTEAKEEPTVKPADTPTEESAKVEPETSAAATTETEPADGATGTQNPYDTLLADLESILKEADYDEVYGLKLTPSGDLPTSVILQVSLNLTKRRNCY
jgi:hypothetical protein